MLRPGNYDASSNIPNADLGIAARVVASWTSVTAHSATMKRIAIITGASGGIGLATAEALAKGILLRVVGRTPAKLDAAVEGLRSITTDVKGFQADFSSLEQVRELAATF